MDSNDEFAERQMEYVHQSLDTRTVDEDPVLQFGEWFYAAQLAGIVEPDAMSLATASADGIPSVRTVLLKSFDERGFVFYTNYNSRKSKDLEENPHAALVILWKKLERQVKIQGSVARISESESDLYFRQRPRGSQLGAWASPQSERIEARSVLEERLEEARVKFEGFDVPRPPYWGGFVVIPERIEFWQGRADRLHDRIAYFRSGENWLIQRLAP